MTALGTVAMTQIRGQRTRSCTTRCRR